MARYAKVDVRVWDDEKVSAMTPIPPCGQGVWIRLLVSRHRTAIPGLLCVGEMALAEEFGWLLEAFREAFREAYTQGLVKADWKARVVWMPNAWRYNSPESINVVKSWRIPWDETPECDLKREAYRVLKAFVEGMTEGFQDAFRESCGKPSAKASPIQEQEQEQEQEPKQDPPIAPQGGQGKFDLSVSPLPASPATLEAADVRAVVTHYQGHHPRACPNLTSKSTEWRKIKARLAEGSTVADLCKAIDGYHRHTWHIENGQLGLELIVRDASHVSQGIGWADQNGTGAPSQPTRHGHARAEDSEFTKTGRIDL